ncbi:hypothetical protein LEP1GSC052_2414 [Leptospira kmetyi serovar Malaysia str. Bejo-Iso9]|nr:hypothetical protein LEP1GSC052_2414 [Leptospira kmetyi serovar Malaysia str. Bejo-Iso9]
MSFYMHQSICRPQVDSHIVGKEGIEIIKYHFVYLSTVEVFYLYYLFKTEIPAELSGLDRFQ